MVQMIERVVARVDQYWDRVVGRISRAGLGRHIAIGVIVVSFVALETARRSLDQAVAKVHPNGMSGVSANVLHDGKEAAQHALELWEAADTDLQGFVRAPARNVALYQTIAELLLVPFAFVVYYGLTRWLRSRATREEQPAQHRALLLSSAAVPLYAGLGALNQLAEITMIATNSTGWVATPLRYSSLVRGPSRWLILIPVAAVLAPQWRRPFRWFRNAGSAYRVLLSVALVHLLLLTVSTPAEQARDALRLWPDRPALGIWGLGATSMFSAMLGAIALRLTSTARVPGNVLDGRGTWRLLVVGAGIVVAGVVVNKRGWGHGVTALGIVIVGVAALSLPVLALRDRDRPASESSAADTVRLIVPAMLAMSPLLALTHALVKTAVPAFIDNNRATGIVISSIACAVLAVVAYAIARGYGEWVTSTRALAHPDARRRSFAGLVSLPLIAALLVAVWVTRDPWEQAPKVGVIGLLGTFLVLLVIATGLLAYVFDGKDIPAALDFVQLRRVPVVGLIIAWAVVGNLLPDGRFHEVRTLNDAGGAQQMSVEAAFDAWVKTATAAAPPAPEGERQAVPMVFVMASGGGIKAAAFTAVTLECLFASLDPGACAADSDPADGTAEVPDAWGSVFAASGASGGSVGIASLTAQRSGLGSEEDWVFERLGSDLLSPELSWQLFVEIPNTLLTFNTGMDRAEVLERTWEGRFEQGGAAVAPASAPYFVTPPEDSWPGPLLFLNGTNLVDGCRVNISIAQPGVVLDTTPAEGDENVAPPDDCRRRRLTGPIFDQTVSRNAAEYLCDQQNISLATAAFLSARFPIVSPAGELPRCEPEGNGDQPSDGDVLAIGDGGYRDNTGAAAIDDVWSIVETKIEAHNQRAGVCIVPILVEIDNGYANRGTRTVGSVPYQLTAPLTGLLGVIASRDAGPIEAVASEFAQPEFGGFTASVDGEVQNSRFVRVSLFDHPGVTAPLGWSLSNAAINDITRQIDGVEDNTDAAKTMTRWLHGSLTCE
jgi:hypothetical protein